MLCNAYQSLLQQAGDVKELTAGLIRIGTFSSVATHWLPSIIREFQKDYPNIEYEFLLGDYREIEAWIQEGWVDCGFLCLPVRPDLDTIFLERDDFLAILPATHPLAQAERIFLDALCKEPVSDAGEGQKCRNCRFFPQRRSFAQCPFYYLG